MVLGGLDAEALVVGALAGFELVFLAVEVELLYISFGLLVWRVTFMRRWA